MIQKVIKFLIGIVKIIFGIKDKKDSEEIKELNKKEKEILSKLDDLEQEKKALTKDSIQDIIDRLNSK